ncbi:transient receptor potential cation channel subfamily V member 5-like [Glandiceps talaboti]
MSPGRENGDEDPDYEWKKQNEEEETNPIYQLVKSKNGGSLLSKYDTAEKIKNELENEFLYDDIGDGERTHTITKSEYISYLQDRAKLMSGTVVKEREVRETFDRRQRVQFCDKFQDHEACWRLDKRGGVGETALHLCYLKNTEEHKAVAKILIKQYPKLVLDIYEGKEYYGESCLHLAIVHGDLDSLTFLVENGARVDQRASGRFFMHDKDKQAMSTHPKYFGDAYYGEYPLHFAASFGNEDMYDHLVSMSSQGKTNGRVDPNAQDTLGNTVLHMMVIHNKVAMYKHVMQNPTISPDQSVVNVEGLTPLALACKLGRGRLFQCMIHSKGHLLWHFGRLVRCVAYPLKELDSIKANGKLNPDSALAIIANSDTDEQLDMLGDGIIHLLLKEKWNVFAKQKFTIRFILVFVHLVIFSLAVYLRPQGDLIGGTDIKDIVRYIAEIMLIINSLVYLGFEIFNIKTLKFGYFKLMLNVPAKTLFLLSCVLILLCGICRVTSSRYTEDICAIFAAPMAWGYLLFFYKGLEWLGPSVIMIYKMTAGDLFQFSIILITTLSAFSPAFYLLFLDIGKKLESFDTWYGTWMYVFHMTFGEFQSLFSGEDDDEIEDSRSPILTKIIFVMFMILVPILLLSMLIAMMTNTYQRVKVRSRKEWQKQWAKVILVLEHSCREQDLGQYQKNYSIDLAGLKKECTPEGNICRNDSKGSSDKTNCSCRIDDEVGDEYQAGILITEKAVKENGKTPTETWKQIGVIARNARQKLSNQKTKGSK